MINRIRLLRNIGLFDTVAECADISLARLTVAYAENGRGKTTLAAILRSLATGDPLPIAERRRLAAQNTPHIVLDCSGGPPLAMFQDNAWNRTLSNMAVFDDQFIDQNIYSGLTVASEHRQNLHELIIGSQGVALNQRLQNLVDQIETHNTELRIMANAIPANERGTLSVDDFCALPMQENIEAEILNSNRMLAAAREQDSIRNTPIFDELNLPTFNITEIEDVLNQDLPTLEAAAAERVKTHLTILGQGAEAWVADGMELIPDTLEGRHPICPFCAQDMQASPVLNHYRGYFSAEYTNLKRTVTTALVSINQVHGGNVPTEFERAVRVAEERQRFWGRFCEVPDIRLDTDIIGREWQAARNALVATFEAKQAALLDRMSLPEAASTAIERYENSRRTLLAQYQTLLDANPRIQEVKERAITVNQITLMATILRLRAIRARHSAPNSILCEAYLNEKAAKARTEEERNQTRTELDRHRTDVFPASQIAVNTYLKRFNAGFTLDNMTHVNTRGGSTCTFNVIINKTPVPITGETPAPGTPSFRNTLSAGDRNTLALAFFLASLDHDPMIAKKVVVIDDPISSMDEHRALTTVQEIRRLALRVRQVIILSHSKPFLCNLWEGTDQTQRAAIQVSRDAVGSTIRSWDVNQDCITEHDRRHTLLREYIRKGTGDTREVARAIRPSLEAFMRVACPEHFPPGKSLGVFRGLCEKHVNTSQEILDEVTTQELRDLVEYANKFHHDTNPAWETEAINDGELHGYVRRMLEFAKR